MAHLTVVGGSSKPPFSVNSRGIAKFKLATRVGARAVIADYAFPNESKPRTITPWPAKQLVLKYYRDGRLEKTLADAIISASETAPNESRSDRSKRTALLRAAKHLKTFGPTLDFQDVRMKGDCLAVRFCLITLSSENAATEGVNANHRDVNVTGSFSAKYLTLKV